MFNETDRNSFDWLLDYSFISLPRGPLAEMTFALRNDGTGTITCRAAMGGAGAQLASPIRTETARHVVNVLAENFPDKLKPKPVFDRIVLDGHRGQLVITRCDPNYVATVEVTFMRDKDPPTAERLMQLLETEFHHQLDAHRKL